MKDKDNDKRLIIPKDSFEEEASEGLGRLNREDASEDLRELKSKMERRVRKSRMIWLPAAAAVAVLLVASTVYIALFRDRRLPETEIAMKETSITDTALIAMAEPIRKTESKTAEPIATPDKKDRARAAVNAPVQTEEVRSARERSYVAGVNKADAIAAMEVIEEEEAAEEPMADVNKEVVVEVMPVMEKAVEYDKKEKSVANDKREKAAATKTMEDSAAAMPSTGAGMPGRQAAPVGGMEELNQWIRKNIRYPEEVTPRVQQMVVVTFKISADSTLYDLKAVQTPGIPFTNEAFRLLREGPKWVPAVRNGKVSEEEVRVSIVFK